MANELNNNRRPADFVNAETPITAKEPHHGLHVCPAADRIENRPLRFATPEFPQNSLFVRVGFHNLIELMIFIALA
jgi:hypothetical protein